MTIESDKYLAGLRRAGSNQYDRRLNSPLTEGLVVTIEPIIAAGSDAIVEGHDVWTIKTADGSPIVLTAA